MGYRKWSDRAPMIICHPSFLPEDETRPILVQRDADVRYDRMPEDDAFNQVFPLQQHFQRYLFESLMPHCRPNQVHIAVVRIGINPRNSEPMRCSYVAMRITFCGPMEQHVHAQLLYVRAL